MTGLIQYEFTATLWQQSSTGGWQFVSLPEEISQEIRTLLRSQEEGWGRMKATANIGNTEWKTAIWFDTKRNTYLLPVKATIRTNEKLVVGEDATVTIWV